MSPNVKIETFILHPDPDIEQPTSPARKAREESLQVIANHEKCLGVFWMKKVDNPSHIVVISSSSPDAFKLEADRSIEWREEVDEVDFTSRTEPLKSHISSEAFPNLCFENGLENITRHCICSLFTFYFPAGIVTEDLKGQIQIRAKQLMDNILPLMGKPMNPISLTSAWTTKSLQIDGQDTYAFLLCTTWANQKSQIQFKLECESWKTLLEDMHAFGSTSQSDFSGTLREVYDGKKLKCLFPDSSSEEEEEVAMANMDAELLRIHKAVQVMQKMGDEIAREFGRGDDCNSHGSRNPDLGSDKPILTKRERLSRIE